MPELQAVHFLCSFLHSLAAPRAGKWYSYVCLSRSAHRALAHSAKQIAGEHMELTVTQQERPWDRPFWKPVHGKEGVFAYLVLIHVLAVIGLILFPVPSLKVVGMTLLCIAFRGLGTTPCYPHMLTHKSRNTNRFRQPILIFWAVFNGSGHP